MTDEEKIVNHRHALNWELMCKYSHEFFEECRKLNFENVTFIKNKYRLMLQFSGELGKIDGFETHFLTYRMERDIEEEDREDYECDIEPDDNYPSVTFTRFIPGLGEPKTLTESEWAEQVREMFRNMQIETFIMNPIKGEAKQFPNEQENTEQADKVLFESREATLLEVIDGKTEICKYDGVIAAHVYNGGFINLEKADLKWRFVKEEYMYLDAEGEIEVLTLDEIVDQLRTDPDFDPQITVIIDEPMGGEIWRYGNYNDHKWYRTGVTAGYC